MKLFLKDLIVFLSALRLWPHAILYACFDKSGLVRSDVERWASVLLQSTLSTASSRVWTLLWLLTWYPEFRNLFYKRMGVKGRILSPLCMPMSTLFIDTQDIGRGFFIQHGFATIIAAKRIGDWCWVNQQVTIGYSSKGGSPILESGVVIGAGAKVIGDVTIGRGAVIGANAVVVKSIPAGATAVGVPARIVRVR